MNASAITGMNEYCTNAFSQFQNSHSRVGTMKKGMNSGPSSAHTADAIIPNDTTNMTANCARPMTINMVQYSRFARMDHGSGCSNAFQSALSVCCASWIDRALRMPAR